MATYFRETLRLTSKSTKSTLRTCFESNRLLNKIRSLEDAQVFISHIKSNYGPLIQYQFSRCSETKRYFGYGFLTFKREDSLKKAVADGFIRVGLKDFELKQTGFIPTRWIPIHKNTGFSGFYSPEELKALKDEQEKIKKAQLPNEPQPTPEPHSTSVDPPSEPFVSALSSTFKESSSSTSEPESSTESAKSSEAINNEESTKGEASSKPFYTPLQKKGMAQIWKTIPQKIKLSEQDSTADEEDNSEFIQRELETSSQQVPDETNDSTKSM
ncbi:hypothetical protein BGZ76_003677 [Entomortierella beljakovae]|nr:hypothetical protein BGZ76_003677 [Entomortierella beljakovae]